MAWVQSYDWDWPAVEESFRQALALEPSNALVLQGSGFVAAELGGIEGGLDLLRRSIELDPLSSALTKAIFLCLAAGVAPIDLHGIANRIPKL